MHSRSNNYMLLEVRLTNIHLLILKNIHMLRWTITFVVIALIAGVLGFGGIAGAATGIAQICFYIFIILFVFSLLAKIFKKA